MLGSYLSKNTFNRLVIFSGMFFPMLAKPNCEAGAYMIHTKATYKKQDNLVYAILSNSGQIEVNSIDEDHGPEPFSTSLVGEYTSYYGQEKCSKVKVKIEGVDNYETPQLKMSKVFCEEASPATGGYILIDTMEKKIFIGKPLSVSEASKRTPAKSERDIIYQNKFPGSNPKQMIELNDFTNLDEFQVYETKIGENFSIVVAELFIKEVAKYFKSEGYAYYGQQYMDFKNVKVGYPVLMFSSGGKTEYVGDGSHCSVVPVMYRNMDLVNREMKLKDPKYVHSRGSIAKADDFPKDENGLHYLGLLDRFRVTNAFDMDGDTKVDVIEINGRFAYRVLDNFKFEVINWGMGC